MALSMDFVKGIYESPFIKVIIHPFKEFLIDFKSIFIKRHNIVRSIIHAGVLFPSLIVGGLLPHVIWPDMKGKLFLLGSALGVPNELLNTFAIYTGAWVVGYPISWLTKQIIRAVCLCKFGDADWILNDRRMGALEMHTAGLRAEYEEAFRYVLYQYHRMESVKSFRDEDCQDYLTALVYGDPEQAYKVMREVLEFKKHKEWKEGKVDSLMRDMIINPAASYYQIDPVLLREILQRLCTALQQNEQAQTGVRDSSIIDKIHHVTRGSLEGFKVIIPEIGAVFEERELLDQERALIHQQLRRLLNRESESRRVESKSDDSNPFNHPAGVGLGVLDALPTDSVRLRVMPESEAQLGLQAPSLETQDTLPSSRMLYSPFRRPMLAHYQYKRTASGLFGRSTRSDDGIDYDDEALARLGAPESVSSVRAEQGDSPRVLAEV